MPVCNCPSSSILSTSLGLELRSFAHVLEQVLRIFPPTEVGGVNPLVDHGRGSLGLDRTLIESWPYVSEILSTHDIAFAAECYVSLALVDELYVLGVLGYRAQPATASQGVATALIRRGATLGASTSSFRTTAPDSTSPTVVEAEVTAAGHWALNSLNVAPIREPQNDSVLLLDSATAAPVRGNPVLFVWSESQIHLHATEITSVEVVGGPDHSPYVGISVIERPDYSGAVRYDDIALLSPSQKAV